MDLVFLFEFLHFTPLISKVTDGNYKKQIAGWTPKAIDAPWLLALEIITPYGV